MHHHRPPLVVLDRWWSMLVDCRHGQIVVDLRRAGGPLQTNDIWIAATAAGAGAMLLSSDDHFSAIARVGSIILSAR